MLDILLRRLRFGIVTILAVTTLTFALVHLAPGEPFGPMLEDSRLSRERVTAFRERYGLDAPLPTQYLRYLANTLRGNLGESFSRQRPVLHVVRDAMPRTLLLMATALLVGATLGIGIGTWQAARRGSLADRVVESFHVIIGAIPQFWIAVGMLLLFAFKLRWFPGGGMVNETMFAYWSRWAQLKDLLWHLVLPASALALLVMALVARYQRATLLDVLPDDYMRTARAKGLRHRTVIARHGLRNALLPTITLLGMLLPALVGGAVFVEVTFSWPGLGVLALDALTTRDYPLMLGTTLLTCTLVVAGNLLADLALAWADPRLRRA